MADTADKQEVVALRKALEYERARSLALERRAEALEEATRRAYRMVASAPRQREQGNGRALALEGERVIVERRWGHFKSAVTPALPHRK